MSTHASRRLTKGQRQFLMAVADGVPALFHKRVVEPIEGLPFGRADGLVSWIGGFRVAGCNALSSSRFCLTEAGLAFIEGR